MKSTEVNLISKQLNVIAYLLFAIFGMMVVSLGIITTIILKNPVTLLITMIYIIYLVIRLSILKRKL